MRLGLLAGAAFLALAACGGDVVPTGPQAPAVEAGALQAAVHDPRVRRFYEARQWRPAWTREAEASLRAALDEAVRHGLNPDDFRRPLDNAREGAAREAALSFAAFTYAEALARGRTDPTRLERNYEIPRPDPHLVAGLERALSGSGDLRGWVRGLAPHDADYRTLSTAYLDATLSVHARPLPLDQLAKAPEAPPSPSTSTRAPC